MKKTLLTMLIAAATTLTVACSSSTTAEPGTTVTLSGNAYVTAAEDGASAFIDESRCEIANWNNPSTVISFYFKPQQSGNMSVALRAKGHSRIEVSLLGKTKEVKLNSDELQTVKVGDFKVDKPGYVKMDIRGLKIEQGETFGNVAAVEVGGNVGEIINVSPTFSTHFGRRGPSTHFGYTLPKDEDIEWFYNEVVVPEDGDMPGSYYMACGFGEGYFGMQNNSPYPRRVLFSVWSPYQTDNAAEIPDSLRVKLVKKGADVTVQDFGNEGAGGQSFMHYDWKPGERCRFLIGVRPDGKGNTVYTAYFFDNNMEKWALVASFRRPQITTWYTHAHSFLENFVPEMGYFTRKALYQNQWARTVDGRWLPVTQGRFTCDTTGHEKQRQDYTGGVEGEGFFLKMGGFFDDFTESRTMFERGGNVTEAPEIDFSTLE